MLPACARRDPRGAPAVPPGLPQPPLAACLALESRAHLLLQLHHICLEAIQHVGTLGVQVQEEVGVVPEAGAVLAAGGHEQPGAEGGGRDTNVNDLG